MIPLPSRNSIMGSVIFVITSKIIGQCLTEIRFRFYFIKKYGTPQGRSSDSSKTLPAWPEFDGQYQTYIELGRFETAYFIL